MLESSGRSSRTPGGAKPRRTSTLLVIERSQSGGLSPRLTDAVHRLCDAAYDTATHPYFASLGPGEHLLGMQGGQLVSHLMWVTRWLEPQGHKLLKTAGQRVRPCGAVSRQGRPVSSARLALLARATIREKGRPGGADAAGAGHDHAATADAGNRSRRPIVRGMAPRGSVVIDALDEPVTRVHYGSQVSARTATWTLLP